MSEKNTLRNNEAPLSATRRDGKFVVEEPLFYGRSDKEAIIMGAREDIFDHSTKPGSDPAKVGFNITSPIPSDPEKAYQRSEAERKKRRTALGTGSLQAVSRETGAAKHILTEKDFK